MKYNPNKDSLLAETCAPHIELTGNSRCQIDGLKRISVYTADIVKLDLGKFTLCLRGDALMINSFSPEGALVEGTIMAVEFESNA